MARHSAEHPHIDVLRNLPSHSTIPRSTPEPGSGPAGRAARRALVGLFCLALVGCGGGSSTDLSLSNYDTLVLEPLEGAELHGTVGELTAERVRLRIVDELGRPVADVPIEFRASASGGIVTPSQVRSNSEGIVETQWRLGEAAGEHQLEITTDDNRFRDFFRSFFLRAWASPGEPERVEVTPGEVELEAGTSLQFDVEVSDQYGNEISDPDVAWESGNPGVAEVNESGRVQSRGAGTTMVSASTTRSSGQVVDGSASVLVRAAPSDGGPGEGGGSPVASVSGTWSIEANVLGGVEYSTLTLEQDGSSLSGTILGNGGPPAGVTGSLYGGDLELSFTAPEHGLVSFSGTVTGDEMSGSIALLGGAGSFSGTRNGSGGGDPGWEPDDGPVGWEPDDGPVGGDPGQGPGNGGSHEPAGFRTISTRPFGVREEAGWSSWDMGGRFEIVQDGTAQHGDRIGRMTYPNGMGSTRPGVTARGSLDSREVYLNFRIRVSDNWRGHDSGINKIFYVTDPSTGGNGSPIYIALWGAGSGSLRVEVHRQNPDLKPGQVKYTPNLANKEIRRGQWHDVEVLLRMNSHGSASDGAIYVWVDGTQTLAHTGERFAPSGNFRFEAVSWEPYWGGQHATLDRTQYMDMDYIYVSGR